ncbi:toast rack family protein [Halobacillus sp. BBL2006]|uniref:toast rack family protein n=1 Tax=Halobacillus sp. BBL2006 TaxID=1543706 RepID=UPI000543CAB9|nr:toast rack family protein [Halobacillus sp. BBL2006]KHE70437.1 hypothetical protein LD39_11565 [Halobacillus sp. BBL2006]
MKKLIQLAGVSAAAVLLLAGCQFVQAGDTESENETVDRDAAESLSVDIDLGVGELDISPGSKNWLDGQFQYNHSKLKPVVSYKLKGTQGDLDLSQKQKKFNIGFSKENETKWDLQLNKEVPTELSVETGVSDSHLDLRGMNLEDLDVDTGVGDVTLDLSGDWNESLNVKIDSGVGNTTIYIPKEVGVKIRADKGVGDIHVEDLIVKGDRTYVNKAYEDGADVVMDIDADLGVGDIEIVSK